MKFLKPFIIILILISSQIISAQITGKVIEIDENNPLEYATIALYKANSKMLITGVITDSSGRFSISNIKPDTYYIEVSFIGYKSQRIDKIIIQKKGEKENG